MYLVLKKKLRDPQVSAWWSWVDRPVDRDVRATRIRIDNIAEIRLDLIIYRFLLSVFRGDSWCALPTGVYYDKPVS